jgi:acetyl-CoA acyltransferase
MANQFQDAYIVAATRTPVGKARGVLRNTRPDDMLAHVPQAVLAQAPGLDPALIGDVIVGCAIPEAEQGMNVARIGVLLAGLPNSVPGLTINRFCASGVQAVAMAADRIRLGEADVTVGAGTETMSMMAQMMGNKVSANPAIYAKEENVAIAFGMGLTAEKVARQWKVSREDQGAFAVASHQKAVAATQTGKFRQENFALRPTHPSARPRERYGENRRIAGRYRRGPASGCSLEGLAKLRPVFAAKGASPPATARKCPTAPARRCS